MVSARDANASAVSVRPSARDGASSSVVHRIAQLLPINFRKQFIEPPIECPSDDLVRPIQRRERRSMRARDFRIRVVKKQPGAGR